MKRGIRTQKSDNNSIIIIIGIKIIIKGCKCKPISVVAMGKKPPIKLKNNFKWQPKNCSFAHEQGNVT